MKEISKEQFIEHSKKLLKLYPDNENLKKNIEYLENGGYEKEIEGINKEYEVYQKLIIEYYTELHLAFNKACENSIDREQLIKIELESIKLLLIEGKKSDLTIFDWTDIFQLPSQKAKEINRFFIKGIELKKIFTGKNLSFEDLDNFAKVRALLFYENDLKELLTPSRPIIKQNNEDDKKLDLPQIALIYVYEGEKITRENGDEIARRFKHNSGERLYQKFTYYRSRANRKGKTNPYTKKKMQYKIKLFESILEFLHEPNKQRALDEINILKINYKNDFE